MIPLYKTLGYVGALPFCLAALATLIFDSDGDYGKVAITIQLIYAGLISSFMSGIHWTHSFPRSSEGQMLLAMVPPIASLIMISAGLFILYGGMLTMLPSKILLSLFFALYTIIFLALLLFDSMNLIIKEFPEDYLKFRSGVTILVVMALIATGVSLWI